jgi:hypothetical protein
MPFSFVVVAIDSLLNPWFAASVSIVSFQSTPTLTSGWYNLIQYISVEYNFIITVFNITVRYFSIQCRASSVFSDAFPVLYKILH